MEQQKYFGTMKTISTPMMIDGLELEPLLKELDAFDYEGVLFQSYMNEGKHQLV